MMKRMKKPLRFLFAALAACGALKLLGCLAAWILVRTKGGLSFSVPEAATIGIIGGADGPTAIFVTASVASVWQQLLWILLTAAGIWGYLRLKKQK